MDDDNWIVVGEAAKPWNGRYPLVLWPDWDTHEFGWCKRFSGRLPADVGEGFDGLDAELFLVLVLIAMRRAGKIQLGDGPEVFEQLAGVPFMDTFKLEGRAPVEEEQSSPPPQSSNENGNSFGLGSPTSSETSETTPPASGTPASATSPSVPATSAT